MTAIEVRHPLRSGTVWFAGLIIAAAIVLSPADVLVSSSLAFAQDLSASAATPNSEGDWDAAGDHPSDPDAGKAKPPIPQVGGTYNGTATDSIAGSGAAQFAISQKKRTLKGSFSLTFSSQDFHGNFTGTLPATDVLKLTLTAKKKKGCVIKAQALILSPFELNGTYSGNRKCDKNSGAFDILSALAPTPTPSPIPTAAPTPTPVATPVTFQGLVSAINAQQADTNLKAFDFASAIGNLLAADFSVASATDVQNSASAIGSTGDDFVASLDNLNDLTTSYESLLNNSGAAQLRVAPQQSVDFFLINDISGLVNNVKTGVAMCAQQFPIDTAPDDYKNCINNLRNTELNLVFNLGAGTVVSGGAGVIAALVVEKLIEGGLITVSAPVPLVVVGTGLGVGFVVGKIWTWCTAPAPKTQLFHFSPGDTGTDSVCAFNSCQATTQMFADGKVGTICSVTPGTGTLTIQPPNGTPIVISNLTIGASGLTVDISACNVAAGLATPADAQNCIANTLASAGVNVQGTSCSAIADIIASVSPPNPVAFEDVTITAQVLPPTSGCSVSYNMSGTDGYTQNDTLSTDSNGFISFLIPGGAGGVVDTVQIGPSGGVNKTLTYSYSQ